MKTTPIRRGQIYFCDIPKTIGSVLYACRPVLIISNNTNNFYSGCFTAVPITSRVEKLKRKLPCHVALHADCGLDRESIAMCENVSNYSKESLREFICELDEDSEEMRAVEEALKLQMGLL